MNGPEIDNLCPVDVALFKQDLRRILQMKISLKADKTVPTDHHGHFGWIKKDSYRYVQRLGIS